MGIASIEVAMVVALLQDVVLNDNVDDWFLTPGMSFSPRNAYHLISDEDYLDTSAIPFGRPGHPSRCKYLGGCSLEIV